MLWIVGIYIVGAIASYCIFYALYGEPDGTCKLWWNRDSDGFPAYGVGFVFWPIFLPFSLAGTLGKYLHERINGGPEPKRITSVEDDTTYKVGAWKGK